MDAAELQTELRRSLLDVVDPHQSLSVMHAMGGGPEVEALIDRLHGVEAEVWALARHFLL